jgi:hypothetical protein
MESQDRNMRTSIKLILIILAFHLDTTNKLNASPKEDAKTVAALDTKYQAAVKANDAATMDQILADDFVLVTGRGKVFSKADLLDSARKKEVTYERQDEEPGSQKVRVWETQPWSIPFYGSSRSKEVNQPITNYGLATPIFALQQVGGTYLAKLPCHCPKRSRLLAKNLRSSFTPCLGRFGLLALRGTDNEATMVSLYPEWLLSESRNRETNFLRIVVGP